MAMVGATVHVLVPTGRKGIMAKKLAEIAPDIWPIGLFLLAAGTLALTRYRQTLD